ncbi:iron-siderophore ABC transporter substrate-binding protein [Reinekea forsetii]|nr:iron-siderophore ABC transporter substrate-binding protein [Reinekea forsetii]
MNFSRLTVMATVTLVVTLYSTLVNAGDFPVTIDHKFGSLTLQEPAKRVVSIGYSDQDDILALGVQPIAVRDWFGDKPFATWPWASDELGDAKPLVLGRDALDFEAIAALNPDLIIGISSGMTQEDYNKLSKIAPTLPQSGDYVEWGMPWQERTRSIGLALGKLEQANKIVDRIESRIEQEAQNHTNFTGKTAAVAFYYSGQPGVYATHDLRSQLLQQLGFVIPPQYDELAGESFYASFSEEKLDLLNVDALLWLSASDALADVDALPLRKHMPFYKEGREVFLGELVGGAFSFMSPLSLEYLLDNLLPELELAIDGDPKTVVPSSRSSH